jgi:hypothetical protein
MTRTSGTRAELVNECRRRSDLTSVADVHRDANDASARCVGVPWDRGTRAIRRGRTVCTAFINACSESSRSRVSRFPSVGAKKG